MSIFCGKYCELLSTKPKISFTSDYPICPVLLIIIFSCKASPLIVNVPRELHAVINKFVTQIFGTGHFFLPF